MNKLGFAQLFGMAVTLLTLIILGSAWIDGEHDTVGMLCISFLACIGLTAMWGNVITDPFRMLSPYEQTEPINVVTGLTNAQTRVLELLASMPNTVTDEQDIHDYMWDNGFVWDGDIWLDVSAHESSTII